MNGLGTAIATRIASLLECICNGLADEGAGPTCWCGFYPGALPTWDYCGECSGDTCGMAYVRMVNSFASTNFPNADITVGCAAPLALELQIGALRCIPVADEQGTLPNEATMWEASLGIVADMSALYLAICNCPDVEVLLGEYTPLGPEGGCAGGEWQVWVTL